MKILHYDDAFIAYINGVEVARANIGFPLDATSFDDGPFTDHEAVMYAGGTPDLFTITDFSDYLLEGTNILSIQAYNINSASSDFTIIPFLTIGIKGGGNGQVADQLNLPESTLHASFKLSSKGEAVYLFATDGSLLDSVQFPEMPTDISYGRKSDGAADWVIFLEPTPNAVNAGSSFIGITENEITFSYGSGIYDAAIYVELTGSESIRYTLDGSEPTENSPLYINPIEVTNNTIIKAQIFEAELLPNGVFTQNYLINVSHSLPIITLNTEAKYLWDNEIGMYILGDDYQNANPNYGANFWEDWEYPFHINYYDEDNKLVLEANAGAKIFGGWSRASAQRSFSLFARAEYGSKNFKYRFFEKRNYKKFEALVLRNSGNDWDRSFMRDGIMTGLLEGWGLERQAYQPTVTYLNGEYWGMYNLREKVNEHFLASQFDINSDDLDLLESNGNIIHGSNAEYIALQGFMSNNSLGDQANYDYVVSQVDETNFITYQMAQIYYNNRDWPGNNIKYWKPKGGKWRWILYDTDFGLGIYNENDFSANTLEFATASNGPNWPNPPWSTFMLRKMLENDEFQQLFVNYFADAMNTIFLPSYATEQVDEFANNIVTEIEMHRNRWGHSLNSWYQHIDIMKNYFNQRPAVMRTILMNRFNLPRTHEITTTIDDVNRGSIQLNSLSLKESNWTGVYFENNPITISAVPQTGYEFDRWSGDIETTDVKIEINLTGDMSIMAHFKAINNASISPIVINEINYKSADESDAGDWVELYNYTDEVVDISEWVFKDGDDDHNFTIPANTSLGAMKYLVLSTKVKKFAEIYPDVANFIGEVDFGFSGSGEALRLYNSDGEIQDSVYYLSDSPWPEEADGKGPTLELKNPELNNTLAENWKAYDGIGTPGALNHISTSTADEFISNDIILFPNPSNEYIHIGSTTQGRFIQSIRVLDIFGRIQISQEQSKSSSLLKLSVEGLPTGQYFIKIQFSDHTLGGAVFQKM